MLSKVDDFVRLKKGNLEKMASDLEAKKAESERKLNDCELMLTKPIKIHELDSRIKSIDKMAEAIERVRILTEEHDSFGTRRSTSFWRRTLCSEPFPSSGQFRAELFLFWCR